MKNRGLQITYSMIVLTLMTGCAVPLGFYP
ncbi:hypothetical protein BCO18175_03525 [Burkholderia contaminans]|nr:hypothetical protein BCO18175_03525 [Burkholderia contaminans]